MGSEDPIYIFMGSSASEEWRAARDTIYTEIMEHGWSEVKQSFV